MVSEDSDQLVPGLLVVHRFGDPGDLDETVPVRVPTRRNHRHARREPLEIELLRGAEWMLAEERNDRLHELTSPRHDVLAQVLLMVVVSAIHDKPPHSEELLQLFEAAHAPRALRHDEPVPHLIAGSVASSARPIRLTDETDREASFSVYKAGDPASPEQPFLLVFRTHHIFTAVHATSPNQGV